MRAARLLKFFPAIWLFASPAHARVDPDRWLKSFPVHLGSHSLTVHGRTGSAALLLDGRKVADATRFDMKLGATVDGVPVAAIWADRGGASCYEGSVLLFAAPLGKPVVQGTVDATACQALPKVALANDQIVVVDPPVESKPEDGTPAVAGSPGAVWLFDAKHGAARAMGIGPEGPDAE